MIIVNSLGALFELDALPKELTPAVLERLPDMVTDQSIGDALASGVTAINMTVGHVMGDVDPFEYTVADIGRWNRLLRKRSGQLLHASTVQDIRRARAEGKIGIIYGFQNSLMLGDKVERVDLFADLGVRVFQLTYNAAVPMGDGAMAPSNRPLSAFGRAVVERLNAVRVLCDLSHSGEQTCLDAIRTSRQPVLISHTGCRALVNVPRNKSDVELRLLADRGGYVGIFFMTFLNETGRATGADVVRHIDHAIRVCGEDHVGIGTDLGPSGVGDVDAYMKRQREYLELRRQQGIAAPGESADQPYFAMDMLGPEQYRKLERMLRQRGYKSARIEKIFGSNFLRVAKEVWGA
jgi:membrane dipeptidase